MPQQRTLTELGRRCRDLRQRNEKLIAQQAYRFRCEPSDVCAIEFGQKPIPPEWAIRFADWLRLPPHESQELASIADIGRTFEMTPKDALRAKLAKSITTKFGRLSPEQIERIVNIAEERE